MVLLHTVAIFGILSQQERTVYDGMPQDSFKHYFDMLTTITSYNGCCFCLFFFFYAEAKLNGHYMESRCVCVVIAVINR